MASAIEGAAEGFFTGTLASNHASHGGHCGGDVVHERHRFAAVAVAAVYCGAEGFPIGNGGDGVRIAIIDYFKAKLAELEAGSIIGILDVGYFKFEILVSSGVAKRKFG